MRFPKDRRLPGHVGSITALLVAALLAVACASRREEKQPAAAAGPGAMDTTGQRYDTGGYEATFRRDSSRAVASKTPGKARARLPITRTRSGSGERAPASSGPPSPALSPAAVQVSGLAAMKMLVTTTVRIDIIRDSIVVLRAAVPAPGADVAASNGKAIVRTKVADEVRVCLTAEAADFRITGETEEAPGHDGRCANRTVSPVIDAPWIFHVTPLRAADLRLTVRVTTTIAGKPDAPVFIQDFGVRVDVRNVGDRIRQAINAIIDWSKTLEGLLVALTAFIGALLTLNKSTREAIAAFFSKRAVP